MRGWPDQTKTFLTKADAEQWASEREAEMRRGTFVDTSSLRSQGFPVEEIAGACFCFRMSRACVY